MSKQNASTEAQRRFIDSLAKHHTDDEVREAYASAAAINGNSPWQSWETLNQATKRLSKSAASAMIDSLRN